VGTAGPASDRNTSLSACSKYGVMCDDAAISGRTALANLTRYNYLRMPQMARAACKFVWLAVAELLSPSWPLSRHKHKVHKHTYLCICVVVYLLEWGSFKQIYVHTHTRNYVNTHTHTHTHTHICIPHTNARQSILNQPLKFLYN
jgi:hypothetical protein